MKKRKRTAKQEYIFESIARKKKENSTNEVAHCDKNFLPLLYPFYKQIWDANPDKIDWLIEDNALSHKKAARLCQKERYFEGD